MDYDRAETKANFPSIIIVMLRQPKSHADEARTDPYWEFGSFGTTGCHWRSVMNRGRIEELDGKRFAFAQGGPLGFRLVHVTPPLSARYLPTLDVCDITDRKAAESARHAMERQLAELRALREASHDP